MVTRTATQAISPMTTQRSTHTATTSQALVSTTVTSPVAAGDTELPVESTAGFVVGATVLVEGGGHRETGIVAGLGSIVLAVGLAHGYPAGSTVSLHPADDSTVAATPAPAAADDDLDDTLEPHLLYAAIAGLVLGSAVGACCWVRVGCPGLLKGVRGRAARERPRGRPRLQDPVVFPGEENPWVPPTTAMQPCKQATSQTAELRLTVEDDPKPTDDPLSVLDQEVLDRVIDVAMKLRRI